MNRILPKGADYPRPELAELVAYCCPEGLDGRIVVGASRVLEPWDQKIVSGPQPYAKMTGFGACGVSRVYVKTGRIEKSDWFLDELSHEKMMAWAEGRLQAPIRSRRPVIEQSRATLLALRTRHH